MRRWPWWGVATLGGSALVAVLSVNDVGGARDTDPRMVGVTAHARVLRMDAIEPEPEPIRADRPRRAAVGADLERQRALMASAMLFLLTGEHPAARR